MNPDENQDFQSEELANNQAESVRSSARSEPAFSAGRDPWLEPPAEDVDSARGGDGSFDQALSQEDADLIHAEDNFMQAFTETEPPAVELTEELTSAEEHRSGSENAEVPLPPLSLSMKQHPVVPEQPTSQGSGEEQFKLTSEKVEEVPIAAVDSFNNTQAGTLEQRVAELQRQEQALQQEIIELKKIHAQLREQIADAQGSLGRLVQEGLKELEQRKQALQISVEQLERRQERVRSEMKTTFAGVSQDLAIRVQSFKDYLVGSLQDLALTAEQLELPKPAREPEKRQAPVAETASQQSPSPKFAEQNFQEQTRKIRNLIDQYRNRPDYYGPPWQLRRTFEPIHAERVSNWFFTQGGRGAIRTMGSRLQNILVSSATISILRTLYGDRLRTLVLADSPERLGEWRRGLQDCLGITRSDFGPDRGVALLEDPEALAQRADRCIKDGLLPFIVIDETEEQISLSILQFPLWLAFAPNPQAPSSYSRDRDW